MCDIYRPATNVVTVTAEDGFPEVVDSRPVCDHTVTMCDWCDEDAVIELRARAVDRPEWDYACEAHNWLAQMATV